jgi:two-component system, NarL family, response regulator LiaR
VGEAANGQEALEQACLLRPDLVLIDVLLPSQDGMTTIAAIRRQLPDTQVVVLTGVPAPVSITDALHVGAIGYLSKNIRASDLRTAVKAAARGQVPLLPPASADLPDEVQPLEPRESLTT